MYIYLHAATDLVVNLMRDKSELVGVSILSYSELSEFRERLDRLLTKYPLICMHLQHVVSMFGKPCQQAGGFL